MPEDKNAHPTSTGFPTTVAAPLSHSWFPTDLLLLLLGLLAWSCQDMSSMKSLFFYTTFGMVSQSLYSPIYRSV